MENRCQEVPSLARRPPTALLRVLLILERDSRCDTPLSHTSTFPGGKLTALLCIKQEHSQPDPGLDSFWSLQSAKQCGGAGRCGLLFAAAICRVCTFPQLQPWAGCMGRESW